MLGLVRDFKKYCSSDQEIILLWMLKFDKSISMVFRFNFQARFFNGLRNGTLSSRYTDPIKVASNDIHILHFNGPKPDSDEFLDHPWTKGRQDLIELYKNYI